MFLHGAKNFIWVILGLNFWPLRQQMIKGFPNEPDVGYKNFFIPRVEKTSKNKPSGRKSLPPKGTLRI